MHTKTNQHLTHNKYYIGFMNTPSAHKHVGCRITGSCRADEGRLGPDWGKPHSLTVYMASTTEWQAILLNKAILRRPGSDGGADSS